MTGGCYRDMNYRPIGHKISTKNKVGNKLIIMVIFIMIIEKFGI